MQPTVKAAWASVFSNTFLVTAKLIVGLAIGSVSVISEAIHSGNDLLASFIALFAVKTSSKPPDDVHPFGHGKIENISGTIEAILIFIAAMMIIKEAVDKLTHGGEMMTLGWGIAVMGLSAAMNLAVSTYLMKIAKQEGSIALEADAIHLRTDVYTSGGVFVGLILIKVTGFTIIDPIAAILVACMIIKAAYDLTRKAFRPLMDTALPQKEIAMVKAAVDSFRDSYISYHDLRTRRAGRECHIDFHLVTSPDMSVQEVHDLCDQMELRINEDIPYCNVLIHVEPQPMDELII
ncbi:MAG: cation diffusion facilitator family transporter [Ignavibacteriales bacterium]